jgi:transcriptional regulator with XRE-family HTH domain
MKKEGKMHVGNAGVTKENNLISNWLKENGDPAIDKLVKRNLAIANRIADILSHKNMKPADLARVMGKQRSEISKWLSGTHSFSTKTITYIECALGEDIISVYAALQNESSSPSITVTEKYSGNTAIDVGGSGITNEQEVPVKPIHSTFKYFTAV